MLVVTHHIEVSNYTVKKARSEERKGPKIETRRTSKS